MASGDDDDTLNKAIVFILMTPFWMLAVVVGIYVVVELVGLLAQVLVVLAPPAFTYVILPVLVVLAGVGAFKLYFNYRESTAGIEARARRRARRVLRRARRHLRRTPSPDEIAEQTAPAGPLSDAARETVRKLCAQEGLDTLPDLPAVRSGIEVIQYEQELRQLVRNLDELDETVATFSQALRRSFAAIELPQAEGDSPFRAPVLDVLGERTGPVVERMTRAFLDDREIRRRSLYRSLRATLEQNIAEASKPLLSARAYESGERVLPDDHPGLPAEIARIYLKNTPLDALLTARVPIAIPAEIRFEHMHIVAGSGAGKTTALKFLIGEDLRRVAQGELSVIVLDSQRAPIDDIARLKLFAEGEPLAERLVLLDASDVEYPLAINMFDMGLDYRKLPMADRERLMNSALDLYEFIIRALLDAPMSSRQATLFRFTVAALFHIPNATIRTFLDVLENGIERYRSHLDELDPTTRHFFEGQFGSPQFKQTKEQVVARLWGVLSVPQFERMFTSPRSKLDLAREMDAGKVILINADKSLLFQQGTELFGRFFLAWIAQCAAQRALMRHKLPVHVYVDEAHDYIHNDEKIVTILEQARKQRIGVTLAHQNLSQLQPSVLDAVTGNTSMKMAAALSARDAALMAKNMRTTADFIEAQKKLSFAAWFRGGEAMSLHFPVPAPTDRMERMSDQEWNAVRTRMRRLYASEGKEEIRPEEKRQQPEVSTAPSSEW